MKNEASWLELFERPVFNDADDPRYEESWKWVQELQKGGRLTTTDVFALQCLIDALAEPATPSVEPAGNGREVLTLKDVEARTIELMEAASGKQGLSVSDWVAMRLREAAERALSSPPAAEQEAVALEAYRAAVRWIAADSWDGCSECIKILQMARSLDDVDWTPDQHAAALKRLYERSGHTARSPHPAPALDGVREAQSKIWQAMGLAVIRDAIREADPNNHETWTRISPQEAKYVRDGLFAAHQALAALSSPSEGESATVSRDTPSFEQVWATKEAEGYRYGEDALEQVRFGWELAVDALGATSTERGR